MPSKRKDGTKSRAKGTRPKSGSRLPALEEKGRREKAFEVFLSAYRKTGKKQDSAELAGVSCRAIQKWRDEYPDYEERFQEAHQAWVEVLTTEAFRRGVEGWDEPVYQKGGLVGTVKKFDSYLLMQLLKKADPSFKESGNTSVSVANQVNQTTIHGNVTIIEDSDWYGNKAHDMAAEAIAAHSSVPLVGCEVQAAGSRETLEQDGCNDASGSSGARQQEREAQGSH